MKPNERIIHENRNKMAFAAVIGLVIGSLMIGAALVGLSLKLALWASIAIAAYGVVMVVMGVCALRSAVGSKPFADDEEDVL